MKRSPLIYPLILCIKCIALTFTVFACSHTPKETSNLESENSSTKPEPERDRNIELAQKYIIPPKFVLPPIDTSPQNNTAPLNKISKKISDDYKLIWQNIDTKLALTQYYNHPHVISHKQKYLSKPSYLNTVTKRSEPFIYYIFEEINKRNLPAELAVLPIVESAYVPIARSRAKATGLWQFMSFTAKEYGLERKWGYDGRHDISASTNAALDYLEELNQKFDGDWLLTLAAYNAGPHRVNRAMRALDANQGEKQYWDLHLPRETREYVPKILALGAIIHEEKLNNSLLHPIANKPYLDKIIVEKSVSFAKIIEHSDINSTKMQILNPALRNHHFPIPEGYSLLVPKDDVELIASTIETLPTVENFVSGKHFIKHGDSLSRIAVQYETTVTALREINNIKGHKIIAGHTLIIPANETSNKISPPSVYIVTAGDSFWKIANQNNTTVERLVKINGRNPSKPLRPGEKILID